MGMPVITPSTTTRTQAITDIIESVALQETALSHILNAWACHVLYSEPAYHLAMST